MNKTPISEDDPLYYEKETARLQAQQAQCACDLMDAMLTALPNAIEAASAKAFQDAQQLVYTLLTKGR